MTYVDSSVGEIVTEGVNGHLFGDSDELYHLLTVPLRISISNLRKYCLTNNDWNNYEEVLERCAGVHGEKNGIVWHCQCFRDIILGGA
jgi:hypothetical protein